LECQPDAVLDAEQRQRVDEDAGLVDAAARRDRGSGLRRWRSARLRDRRHRDERDQESCEERANH
jgi:hypothetical protein